MRRATLATIIQLGGGGGIVFPYTFDPTGLSSFPAGWTGSSTFVISSDVITNTPTLGTEMLTDPGLEGTYTGGANGSLTITGGTPTEISSGTHGGSKAQGWTPNAANQSILVVKTPEAKEWYKLTAWLKRTAGSASNIYANLYQNMQAYSRMLTSASYVQLGGVIYTDTTDAFAAILATNSTAAYDTIVLDDVSLKKITKTSLYKLVNGGAASLTVKGRFTWDSNNLIGVVSHSDGTLNNCMIAYYEVNASNAYTTVALDKIVAGVRTRLVADWSNTPGAGGAATPTATQWLEIRRSGTNATLWHNDLQVGGNGAIPAELQNNTYYGIFDTGGGSTNLFFVGSQSAVNIGGAGSSNTDSTTGYWYQLANNSPRYLVTRKDAANSGFGIATYGLANYANLTGSVQVIFDTTGDNTYPDHLWSVEAFIRKCYADGYKVLVVALPTWTNADLNNGQVNVPMNQTALEAIISLLDHYGITYFNGWSYTQAHVTGGGNISDLWTDQFHPNATGQAAIVDALLPYYVTGGSFTLASRVYPESEALE